MNATPPCGALYHSRTLRGASGRSREENLRICIVVPYDLAEEGGVKRHADHLARVLRDQGDEVEIVGPLSGGPAEPGVRGFGGVVNIPANGSDNRMALLTPPW